MFGRRKREQKEDAAREAERRALFEELAKRPDTICPFLGMAGNRTGYQESVTEEHRCYAFGEPAELSAEQQQKVCLQPGYGNCPRYLRGVLVIPTEELEALRHPAPPSARPVAAAAATPQKARGGLGRLALGVFAVLLLVGAAGAGGYWYLSNQVPSSHAASALPGGTELSAELVSLSAPADGSQRVAATAAIGAAAARVPDTTLVYVLDLSGSTLNGAGCGGDRNRDGRGDTPLDCEIAAATALNEQAVENGSVAEVGLVGFAGGAVTADLAAEGGVQGLTAPDADDNADGIPNVVEALQSAYSAGRTGPVGFRVFKQVETSTETTAFSSGIVAACDVMSQTDSPNRLVVFLSDGSNSSGAPISSVLPCNATAVFQTFAAGSAASCQEDSDLGGLQEIADITDGLCTPVTDLTRLPAILQSVVLPQIVRVQITIDGGEPFDLADDDLSQPLPAQGPADLDVDYPIGALEPGEHEICMTVFASDAGGAGDVQTCSTVDAAGGRLTSD